MSTQKQRIIVNPGVEAIHQEGVGLASIDKSYGDALNMFDKAESLLMSSQGDEAATLDNVDSNTSTLLQMSRIDRDRQFTYARIGFEYSQPEMVLDAYLQMSENVHSDDTHARVRGEDFFEPESWQYLQAEIGASVGLLGRLSTASVALSGGAEGADLGLARRHYEEADERTAGNDQYYATSNAMNAARHERIFGSNKDVSGWLRVANKHLFRAVSSEHPAVKPALATIAVRVGALRTKKSAIKSVGRRP